MPRFRVDVGTLPEGATAVALAYREHGTPDWIDLPRLTSAAGEVEIPTVGLVAVRARVVRKDGREEIAAREVPVQTRGAIVDRENPGDLVAQKPEVRQDGPSLEITPKIEPGEEPTEYEMEVRQGETGDNKEDAVHVGFVQPNVPIRADAWSGITQQKIWTRPIRKEDGVLGDWSSMTVDVQEVDDASTEDHNDTFTGGTITTYMGGFAPLEISSGDLRHKAVYAGDLTGVYAGDATDVYAGDAHLYWGITEYTTPTIDVGAQQDFALNIHPEAGTISRPTMYAGDQHWPVVHPDDKRDGSFHDSRIVNYNSQNGSDETPVVVEREVAVSTTASPSFTDADYFPHVPGTIYRSVRAYAVRFRIYTWWERRITWTRFRIRRWCYDLLSCHLKPWSWIETEATHGFSAQQVVMKNSTTWVKAKADAGSTMPAFGLVVNVPNTDTFRVASTGRVKIASHGLTVGSLYYVSDSTAGALTTTKPTTTSNYVQPFLIPIDSDHVFLLNNDSEVIT